MKTIINLLAICFISFLNAHTVWVETEIKGKINQKHEIKVFFGEIDKPTPTDKWFSDIEDLEVTLTAPSGKVTKIKEKIQNKSYYSVFFTPTEEGTYTINVNHLVKEVFRKMKITYQSIAFVNTTNQVKNVPLGVAPFEMEMQNTKLKKEQKKVLKLLSQGEPNPQQKVKIVADNGWELDKTSNERGEVNFKPLWKGKYLFEWVNSQKVSAEHNGKPYELDYKMVTYMMEVK